jgi:radical SAM protein with 4Fe4S-binding SPASM domain
VGVVERTGKAVNKVLAPLGIGLQRAAAVLREDRATLEITTVVGCPLACDCCPQGLLRSRYAEGSSREMTLGDFRTILSSVPADVRVDFSGMAEPWTATDTTAMFRHALQSGHPVSVYTTLVGMNDDDVAFLIENMEHFGLENPFCLHLPDDEGVMAGFRASPEYRDRVGRVIGAMQKVARSRRRSAPELQLMTMSSHGGVHESIADLVPGPLLPFTPTSRAGALRDDRAARITHAYPVRCRDAAHYDRNVVLPNGDVYVCCMDYGLSAPLGNLLSQTYESLFTSEGMHRLLDANAREGFDEGTVCKSCEWAVRAVSPRD